MYIDILVYIKHTIIKWEIVQWFNAPSLEAQGWLSALSVTCYAPQLSLAALLSVILITITISDHTSQLCVNTTIVVIPIPKKALQIKDIRESQLRYIEFLHSRYINLWLSCMWASQWPPTKHYNQNVHKNKNKRNNDTHRAPHSEYVYNWISKSWEIP